MDNALLPYLAANDDRERQQQLDELLTLRAAPLIRGVLLRRLGFYVSASGVNQTNRDAEDLYQEAMTRVTQGLNQLQPSGSDIENFELYVSRLAENICIDFLRAKSPARTRLKYSIRDVLRRHKDLVSWQYDGEVLCGLVRWRNTGRLDSAHQSLLSLESYLDSFRSFHFADEDIHLASLTQVMARLFQFIGGPVELDLLVRMTAYLLDVKDQPVDSFDNLPQGKWDGQLVVNPASGGSPLEASELLASVWRAVIQLPAEQRDAFVFSFEDEAGQDLFTVLMTAEIVNWDELARGMDRSVAEVVRLRRRMPMDGATAAKELGASREHVYKWRFRAIRRLKTDLGR